MIDNWNYHSLHMDFSSSFPDSNHPSDIDMFYLTPDGDLVLGEIKNQRGILRPGQRHILERLAEGWGRDAIVLYITHDKFYQNGDRRVDVGSCLVKQIYYKTKHDWRTPREPTTVRQVIEHYMEAREDGTN